MHPEVAKIVDIVGRRTRVPSHVPWIESDSEVGFNFPADYRGIIDEYGSVLINGELNVWTPKIKPIEPEAPNSFSGFVYRTKNGVGEYFLRSRERHPEEYPYPVFPEPGGLLAWGNNYNADSCFWLTKGDEPDKWPIVVWYRQLGVWDRFDGCVAEFLLSILTGNYGMADEIAPCSPGVPIWQQRDDWAA